MMKKIFIGILFLFASVAFAALPANKIYEQNVNSILFVETQTGSGSGIILQEDGTFVTCFHVIAEADYIKVKTIEGKEYNVNGYRYLNPENDVAILTLATSKKFTPISTNNSTKIGDSIFAIANPKGLKFVFSDGMINQLSNGKIQFSAPSSQGSSGGALLNQSGELVGMITSQYSPSQTQNINFAIPNSYYMQYVNNKKRINTKKINWTDFVIKTLNKKDFENYFEYAYETKNYLMLYKYIKYSEKINSDEYAMLGSLGTLASIDSHERGASLDEAKRWFALSIINNKNLELSAYGLFLIDLLKGSIDKEYWLVYNSVLKKYPKSKKQLIKDLNGLLTCKESDSKCVEKKFYDMSAYLISIMENCR